MRRDWLKIEIGTVCELNPKPKDKSEISPDLEVQFVPMKLVDEVIDHIHLTDTRPFGQVSKGSYTFFAEGDILFAKVTPCMENGKIAVANGIKNGIGYGSSEFHVFRTLPCLQKKYLFYYLVRSSFRSEAQHAMTGAVGLRRVPKKFLQDYPIPLPPLPEQRAIVSKIEQLFSELDNGIANLKTAQEQLKVYRQAVLKKAFEGELTKKWREEQTNLPTAEELLDQIKEEREKRYKRNEYYREVKESKHSILPYGWQWLKSGNICQSIVPNRDKPKSFSGNIPWLTTPDLSEDKIDIDFGRVIKGLTKEEVFKYNARLIPEESVIMTCVGNVGTVAVTGRECVINQQLHAFLTHPLINPRYLAYAVLYQKNYLLKESTSTTIAYLNKTKCNSVPIPYCSLPEQFQIVQEIESRLFVCDKVEESIKESLDKAEALRQSILKKAFEGKLLSEPELEACRKEPDWEPAEKLLERIREGKSSKPKIKSKAHV